MAQVGILKIRDTRAQREIRQYVANVMIEAPATREKLTAAPLRYYGSKFQIADWIIEAMPRHTCYVEPYSGGAAVLFCKTPAPYEVLNDLNGDLINFFRVLRETPEKLLAAIALTPYSWQEYRDATQESEHPVERVRRFYVLSRQGYAFGGRRINDGWSRESHHRQGFSRVDRWNTLDQLILAARRLKSVQIESDDALKVIRRYDTQGTLFYVDPPYVLTTRYASRKRYTHEMDDQQHQALAAQLHQVQGMVMISGYRCDLYDALYSDWRRVDKRTSSNGNSAAMESLWISPAADAAREIPLQTHFLEMAGGVDCDCSMAVTA